MTATPAIEPNGLWDARPTYGSFGMLVRVLLAAGIVVLLSCGRLSFAQESALLARFLPEIPAGQILPGADGYGAWKGDLPVAPVMRDGEIAGYAYITSDFVGTTGYSGKPIHVLVVLSPDAKLITAKLVKHWEPIVLIGIPEHKIRNMILNYADLDLVEEAAAGGSGHDVDIISGATVTVMVIDDSIVRSGIKVARALGLGGLMQKAQTGPRFELDPNAEPPRDWSEIAGDGTVRRLTLDVGQINVAFAASGDERAAARPEPGEPSETFIDLETAVVSVPQIGRALLGDAEYANLLAWLEAGEHAIVVAGRGRYSFKGSGYVRGGIFDRIQLIQGDNSVRFRDKMQRRLGELAIAGAPSFTELDLFKIPADAGFDPTEPWRLQLLVHRAIGPVKKAFQTFDLGYRLPDRFTRPVVPAESAPGIIVEDDEAAAKQALWQRIWWQNKLEIGVLVVMLAVLTGGFFFQMFLTRNEKLVFWFRIGFLTMTLVFLGWYANAQLSVVNLMALAGSVTSGFTWDAFLLDPLVFILWFSVAAALIFWGRGAYCGWLCPFGALQELTNRIAKLFNVPQFAVPWGLHERLWPLKYIIFLGLFGLSLASLPLAERFAEVEPFKTAIILKFQRAWPFVAFAVGLIVIGLFVERFYCRYLCPLGAALAIPGRMRMFDWLKRYHDCGNPCQICHKECMVQAIHPTGQINPNECLNCMHCQVRYQDDRTCPVRIKRRRRLDRLAASADPRVSKSKISTEVVEGVSS